VLGPAERTQVVQQFFRGNPVEKSVCCTFFKKRVRFVNSWDLVDGSAYQVLGTHLLLHPADRKVLYKLAKSKHWWERRIAIIATYAFIRAGESKDTLALAETLLHDPHDLMHKAVGWMLRELGQRVSNTLLRTFLGKHAEQMPRTALRYAIEHFTAAERKRWLAVRQARGS
jgi:3-methyladenine DNA glycosylase AlkD